MVQERLREPRKCGSSYYMFSFDMEGSSLSHYINQIVEVLLIVRNEVRGFGEDSQARMQDLAYKVQLILEWCERIAISLWIPPHILEGIHPDIPIHDPGGLVELGFIF